MKTIIYKGSFVHNYKDVHVALGNFDGVHQGHCHIIEKLVESSRQRQGTAIVATFDPHPLHVIRSQNPPKLLTPTPVKIELMRQLGVDALLLLSFNEQLAQLSPDEFVDQILQNDLRSQKVMVGFNYSFGRQGVGTSELLEKLGKEKGFDVEIIDAVMIDGEPVSSTRIRNALAEGDLEKASRLLGYRPFIAGKVISGEKRGRKLGFPTMNLQIDRNQLLPRRGVYIAFSTLPGFDTKFATLVNIGVKPTFGNYLESVEAHILDFSGHVYGQTVIVHLLHLIRPEIAFEQVSQLVEQMEKDKAYTRQYLQRQSQHSILEKIRDVKITFLE
ncbi:bifunctional riboflavin kinase/FAD synthetase [Heliorestis convoluta]|nr:bifunctional riboflavin kinase/FAD synthetase [Heliorestis convoluta]